MNKSKIKQIINPWESITLLKCLAAILITNAHLTRFYPESIQFISFGGALGNSLFFLCSGWALTSGVEKMEFFPWYCKRGFRVLLPVWIFMIITLCLNVNSYHWYQFIQTPYWFLNAILFFYIPYYLIIRYAKKWILSICGLLCLGCLVEFLIIPHNSWMMEESVNDVYIHYWFYFLIMLVGVWIRINNKSNDSYCIKKCIKYALGVIVTFMLYMGNKYYIIHTGNPIYSFQLFLPICLLGFAICFYRLAQNLSALKSIPDNNKVINFIAANTLEIYIVQFTTAHYLVHIPFPFGLICDIIAILVCAKILNFLSSKIQEFLV